MKEKITLFNNVFDGLKPEVDRWTDGDSFLYKDSFVFLICTDEFNNWRSEQNAASFSSFERRCATFLSDASYSIYSIRKHSVGCRLEDADSKATAVPWERFLVGQWIVV